jgi:hypothetical protein
VMDAHTAERRWQACGAPAVRGWLAGMAGQGSEAVCVFNYRGVRDCSGAVDCSVVAAESDARISKKEARVFWTF